MERKGITVRPTCVWSKCEPVIIHMWALLFHNSLNTSVPHGRCSEHGTQESLHKAHYMNLAQRLSQHRIVPFSILPFAINVNTIGSKVTSVGIWTHTHTMVSSQVNLYLPIRIIIFCTVSNYALYITSIDCWQTIFFYIYNTRKRKRTNKRNVAATT